MTCTISNLTLLVTGLSQGLLEKSQYNTNKSETRDDSIELYPQNFRNTSNMSKHIYTTPTSDTFDVQIGVQPPHKNTLNMNGVTKFNQDVQIGVQPPQKNTLYMNGVTKLNQDTVHRKPIPTDHMNIHQMNAAQKLNQDNHQNKLLPNNHMNNMHPIKVVKKFSRENLDGKSLPSNHMNNKRRRKPRSDFQIMSQRSARFTSYKTPPNDQYQVIWYCCNKVNIVSASFRLF